MLAGIPDADQLSRCCHQRRDVGDCSGLMFENVCVKGRNGAPIVTLLVSPERTLLVKKPVSWR